MSTQQVTRYVGGPWGGKEATVRERVIKAQTQIGGQATPRYPGDRPTHTYFHGNGKTHSLYGDTRDVIVTYEMREDGLYHHISTEDYVPAPHPPTEKVTLKMGPLDGFEAEVELGASRVVALDFAPAVNALMESETPMPGGFAVVYASSGTEIARLFAVARQSNGLLRPACYKRACTGRFIHTVNGLSNSAAAGAA